MITKRKTLAVYLLRVIFSIYLGITVFITTTQMLGEYWRSLDRIRIILISVESIFLDSLTTAAWTFDSAQLEAHLDGILKVPVIIGIKIDDMEEPPDWKRPFPIALGTTNNDQSYLQLIEHSFQLKKNDMVLGKVTFYSSYAVAFHTVKYGFLLILVAAIIKGIVLWILFLWAFNRFLVRKLNLLCDTMDNVNIDNPKSGFLKLQHDDVIEEFCRIEIAYNNLLRRVVEKNNELTKLNANLELIVILRTKELEQVNAALTQLSITDSLTGLANRRYFDEVLKEECDYAERTGLPLTLMMLDVDLFKNYNDCYGHVAGDKCLIRVANILKTHAHRGSDMAAIYNGEYLAARYGGEEFAFVAPATDLENALQLAQTICSELETEHLSHQSSPFEKVTISIGVAAFGLGDSHNTLIKKADQALYSAKELGRNRVAVFN
jgi:diguanylate cyclase